MASRKPPNYLRANRKRTALSQEDVAFMLGVESGAKVCRYEQFSRVPSLEAALTYEAIFQKPVSELFAGLYQECEQQAAARAEALGSKLDERMPNRHTVHKRQTLENIVAIQKKPKD